MGRKFNFPVTKKFWLGLIIFLFILVSSFLAWNSIKNLKTEVYAKSGVIDLTKKDLALKTIALNGEWKFLWKKFTNPNHFHKEEYTPVELPKIWNGLEIKGEILPPKGYASFQLEILLNPSLNKEDIAIYIPYIHSSYTLYVNDKLVAEVGKISTSESEYIPVARTHIFPVKEFNNPLKLTLHVANYAYSMGGIWQSPRIGSRQTIQALYDQQLAFDIFTFGCLFLMSLYHIALFYLRRRERSNLYFGLLCFFLAIKNLFSGVVFFYSLWPEASYEIGLKLIHISIFTGVLFLWLFLRELFKNELPAWGTKFITSLTSVCVLITLVTSSQIYSKILLLFWAGTILTIVMIARGIYLAVKRKREGSLLILAGIMCLIITFIHDLAIDFKLIKNIYLSGLGFFLFIFSQALLLAVKFTNSFQKIEKLTTNLIYTNESFSRFVPSEFLSYLKKSSITELNLGDNLEQQMTVFFSDIRSYTTLSESMSPMTNFAFINEYLGRVVHYIHKNGGQVNQYLGDGILAVFKNSPENAINAATEIQKDIGGVKELGGYELKETLKNGIGIHSGSLILGLMGTKKRMSVGLISDTVNTASRIEGLTKFFGTQIIISEDTLNKISDISTFALRFLGKVQLKGKLDTLKIYEILNELPENQYNLKKETQTHFEKALSHYFLKEFSKAIELLNKVYKINPDDKATEIYIKNSEYYLNNGVPENWQGALKMEIK